ncbi:MAG: hypothetical protein QOD63_1720 [Actinomycetota bacterium]|jgi:hypothetical protein|nr:hypothetical protein [Actinomycetota bacterium]
MIEIVPWLRAWSLGTTLRDRGERGDVTEWIITISIIVMVVLALGAILTNETVSS